MSKHQPTDRLPPAIDPRKLCYQGIEMAGSILLEDMERLGGAIDGSEDHKIDVALTFERDIERRLTITGFAEAVVHVECQRCMKPMPLPLKVDISLGIVWTEETAKELPSHLDPLIIGDDKVNTAHIVEEELLLALPFVNYHREEDCQLEYKAEEAPEIEPVQREDNPFAILGALKGKGKESES